MQPILQLVAALLFDGAISWVRMLIALFLSIFVGIGFGIAANRSSSAERVLLPLFDILQTLPILAFFPLAIYIVMATLPPVIGINAAVILLIFTSMVWNIGFGAYEAIRTMPREFAEVAETFRLGPMERLSKVLVPAAMPKVVEQSMLSWSIGLFYLVTSEIFSTGSQQYSVRYGIGAALVHLAFSGDIASYVIGIAVFIAFVVVTRLTLFSYLEDRFVKRDLGVRRPKKGPSMMVGAAVERRFEIAGRIFERRTAAAIGRLTRIREARRVQRRIRDGSLIMLFALISVVILILLTNSGIRADEAGVLYAMALSLGRISAALAVIAAISIPLGIYIVFITKNGGSYTKLFQILASIPATLLLPALVIALRGAPSEGELVALLIFFLSGFWYMLFGIISTRATLDRSIGEVREAFGVRGGRAWRFVYLGAIMPGLITGTITAIAAEWNASIVAEYFTTSGVGAGTAVVSVGNGLGKLLDLALSSGNLQLMALGLINLTIIIIVLNRVVWKRAYNRVMSVYR